MLPGKVKGIGGAMDLVASPEKTKVVVTMVGYRNKLCWMFPVNYNFLNST
jgi:acyl CoA:acetate/3-ketoacid CoA transferase beta subunit